MTRRRSRGETGTDRRASDGPTVRIGDVVPTAATRSGASEYDRATAVVSVALEAVVGLGGRTADAAHTPRHATDVWRDIGVVSRTDRDGFAALVPTSATVGVATLGRSALPVVIAVGGGLAADATGQGGE